MAGSVTSIANVRAAAVRRAEQRRTTRRAILLLLGPVVVLLVVGLGAVLSASSVLSLREYGDSLYFFKRQLLWVAGGVVALVVGASIPYRVYQRSAGSIYALSVIGLLGVLASGVIAGGSRRWLVIGPLTLQPSEFSKFAVIVFLAAVMVRKGRLLHDFGHFILPVAAALGVTGVLIMAQPDLGTTLIIAAAGLAVVMASTAPLRYVVGTAGLGGVVALALAKASPYRWERVVSFMDPFADPYNTGFQAVQSLYALGSGGWLGVGLGASRARWEFLPNAHTDFIFAIIGEETGLLGALAVVGLFVLFTVAAVAIAGRAVDEFGKLLASGILAWITVQAIVNIGGVTSSLPITGVPLPFVSFGGSAMVASMGAVGVLVNIARTRLHADAP